MTDELPPQSTPPVAAPEPAPVQTGQPQPDLVDFAVDGEVYKLDARLARRLAADVATPPAQPQYTPQPQYQQPQQAPAPDLADLLFRDPRTAITRLKDEVRTEILQEYQREKTQENFWSGLYRQDNNLRQIPREFINGVVVENQRMFQGLSDEQALGRVAQLVKEKIASFARLGQNTQPAAPTPPTYADGGATPAPAPQPQEGEDGMPQTISQVLRQKQEARRRGGMSPQS